MSADNNGGPAFPQEYTDLPDMTLRQWYAGMALQGLVSSELVWKAAESKQKRDGTDAGVFIATVAFEHADAMLAFERREDKS